MKGWAVYINDKKGAVTSYSIGYELHEIMRRHGASEANVTMENGLYIVILKK